MRPARFRQERIRKELLGILGVENKKTQKPHAEQTAKYITHKGSNAFPETNGDCRTPLADRFWEGLGEAISCRSVLQDFGKKDKKKAPWRSLGPKTKQHKNRMRKDAKYITHKGSNAFP